MNEPRVAYVGTIDCPTPACGFSRELGNGQADVVEIGVRTIVSCPRCGALRGLKTVDRPKRVLPDIDIEPKSFKRIGA